ncbi:MAG: helix-turn-helix domain-containing protein [Nitrospirales bacterium]
MSDDRECRRPPKKLPGQGCGPRTIDGAALDVRGAAAFLGMSEKTVRGMIERNLLPYRRLSSRLIFVKNELEGFLVGLPGCTAEQARENLRVRKGLEG